MTFRHKSFKPFSMVMSSHESIISIKRCRAREGQRERERERERDRDRARARESKRERERERASETETERERFDREVGVCKRESGGGGGTKMGEGGAGSCGWTCRRTRETTGYEPHARNNRL